MAPSPRALAALALCIFLVVLAASAADDDEGDSGGGAGGGDEGAPGSSCDMGLDCDTGNCRNGVCCMRGEECCRTNAGCGADERCDAERFYCVEAAPAAQVTRGEVERELDSAGELRDRALARGGETAAVNATLAQARQALSSGDTAQALKLAVQARTEAEQAIAAIKKRAGEACSSAAECETGNCNTVCCTGGNVCCTSSAQCKPEERCDEERHYCVGPGSSEAGERPKGIVGTAIYYREVIETALFFGAAVAAVFFFVRRRGRGVAAQEAQDAQWAQAQESSPTGTAYGGYYAMTYNYGYAQPGSPYAYPTQDAAQLQAGQAAGPAPPLASSYGAAPSAEPPPAQPGAAAACPSCGAAFDPAAGPCPYCGWRAAQ